MKTVEGACCFVAQKAVAVERSLKKIEEPVSSKRLLLAEPGYLKSSKAEHS